MEVIHLTERNEDVVVDTVVSLLGQGGVIAVPTDTVYGLIADVLQEAAVRKVFRLKARSHTKALPAFIRDVPLARQYAYIDGRLWRILESLWPGQTTVVLKKKPSMPDLVTGGTRTIGLRVPDHPFLEKVLARFPHPLTGTSANLSGGEPAQSGVEVQNAFRHGVPQPDLIVDAGTLPPSPPSTVFDLTKPENPKILRIGAITKEKLDEVLRHWKKPV